MKKLNTLLDELLNEILKAEDLDKKIEVINYVRKKIHEVSPFKHHPVDYVFWEKSDTVEGNDYNPNSVPPPEMKLLIRSIIEDGFTMPIVSFPEEITRIVDGYHRRKSERISKEISESTYGYIPLTTIRKTQEGIADRMASTIRHNRARGNHSIELMQNIVAELVEIGMSDAWIMKNIGMDADELLRLKQVTGIQALFANKEFSKTWEDENS